MSRIVIVGLGTRGDVAPLAGLGARLLAAGHHVVLATHSMFADMVAGAGLEFRQVGDNVSVDDLSDPALGITNPLKAVMTALAPRTFRALGRSVIAAVRDVPADILLLSPLAEAAGYQLAEAKQIPSIGVRLQPLSASVAYPPAVLGAWSAGRFGNRLVGRLSTATIDRIYAHAIADLRDDLDLPRLSARRLRRRRTGAGWPILYGYSPTVLPRPADWRPGIDVVGYWWPPTPAGWQPPPELTRFLDNGPAPVYLGFGSILTNRKQAARLSAIVATTLRQLGARAVVQAGWAGLNVNDTATNRDPDAPDGSAPSGPALLAESADVLTIGEAPHEWLFPRMAAVVHHCGAGTTAAGLRAGIPAVGVPLIGDQPFWARCLRTLGVSAATVPQYRLNPKRLTTAIETALTDTTLAANAHDLAHRLATEDGATAALTTINDLLATD